jgi:hypothetical protein
MSIRFGLETGCDTFSTCSTMRDAKSWVTFANWLLPRMPPFCRMF